MPATKDVDCKECGAIVTLCLNEAKTNYTGECDGCEAKIESGV